MIAKRRKEVVVYLHPAEAPETIREVRAVIDVMVRIEGDCTHPVTVWAPGFSADFRSLQAVHDAFCGFLHCFRLEGGAGELIAECLRELGFRPTGHLS